MKLLTLLFTSLFLTTPLFSQNSVKPAIPQDEAIEKRVEETLSKMTLEEKIGQMTEIVIDLLGKVENGVFVFNEEALDYVIGKYKVGSIFNAPGATAISIDQWETVIKRIQEKSIETMGIPTIYGLDQNHGVTYYLDGTLFPQNINVAASFNRQIAYESARITAYETKAGSCPWTYSPTLDLSRDPRWPRLWENFGEDAYLSAEMGRNQVLGFQGEDPNHIGKENIAVSLKHYMGYGVPRTGKDRTPAYISEADLREKHFAPYLAAVQAGALSVMANSASVNGVPVHMNYRLLTTWLKDELNWDGVIVTDYADINNLFTREKVASSRKEAIKMAINAGIDMAMEPYQCDFCDILKELVNEGEVSMSRIDDATRRVLRLKFRLGLFDTPYYNKKDFPLFGGKEHAVAATNAAVETMVLLKNNNSVLPLAKGKKILLTGPNANNMRCLNGGWSYTWQGHLADRFAAKYNTILESMQNAFGSKNIIFEPGVTYKSEGQYWEENAPEIQKAVDAAAKADVIVACIGENSYCETPGNLNELAISSNQRELVKALAATGKPIVLILNEGRPRIINDIEPLASSIVDIMLPSNYGADALALLLSGKENFSGKLPFTYPRYEASLTNYDFKVSEQLDPMQGVYDYNAVVSVQWAFGYGLSYTTFKYSNFKVNHPEFTSSDKLVFSIDVTNTGKVSGKEAVLLFSSDLVASTTPDYRRLRDFDKVELKPGETRTITLEIEASELSFVNPEGKWTLEPGEFLFQIADQSIKTVMK